MDLEGWLRSLGLDQYEAAFRENAIDFSILPDLTDQDLEKIGVLLGHRRKLLRAIANLETRKASASTVATSAAMDASPRDAAERRQVTVMFSDLVGSTALSARMDPEDLRELISAYQKCVADTVQRFGGFVAKYMGDGVLVYFGYPRAHEDDTERAVRAGLALVAAVGGLKTHAPLQTRVGVATGLVVVGDLIGSGASQEQAIVGETPNLAARLQSIAEPNNVVIAESTRKLVGNLLELRDVGAQELKGIAGPVRAWAALRSGSVESRFEAFHATGLTELVGREEELELLLRRWSKAKLGEGQVVLLSGEAGIGKSRLTAALLERVATEPHTCLRYFCSPTRRLAEAGASRQRDHERDGHKTLAEVQRTDLDRGAGLLPAHEPRRCVCRCRCRPALPRRLRAMGGNHRDLRKVCNHRPSFHQFGVRTDEKTSERLGCIVFA
jgi:class 3 adenylate cyclase